MATESSVISKLIEAHNEYVKLQKESGLLLSQEGQTWCFHFHALQGLMASRLVFGKNYNWEETINNEIEPITDSAVSKAKQELKNDEQKG